MQVFKKALVAAGMGAVLTAGTMSADAAVFTAADIVNDTIVYTFNLPGNMHYLNGVSTGQDFSQAAFSIDAGIALSELGGGGAHIEVIRGQAYAGAVRQFVYQFTMPENYMVTSAEINYRFTEWPGSGINNKLSLEWSLDNMTYTSIASLTSGNKQDDVSGSVVISELNGATTYYVRGVFAFTGTGSDSPDTFQIFRGLDWTNTISVAEIPEPASLGLLGLTGAMLMLRRK